MRVPISPQGRANSHVGLGVAAKLVIGLAAAVALVVAVSLALFIYSVGKDQRKNLDVVTGFGTSAYLVADREEIIDTSEARPCARLPNCVQAAESPRVRILRFDSKSAAGAYVLQLPPYGYHSDWFVVEFLQPGTMTRDDYRHVESIVYGTASDSPD